MASNPKVKGGSPIVRPKLIKFDPYLRAAKKLASQDLCSNWSFFENPDCIMIDDDISGRVAHNAIHRVEFFYIGRPTNQGKPTVVKFSFYQGAKIASFLTTILEQYAETQEKKLAEGLEDVPLIPYLRGKEDRTYSAKDENRLDFWTHPDLDLGSVKVSVILNKTLGLPEVLMNSPVPKETSHKLNGWPGPVIGLSLAACANLEAFIMEKRKDNIDFYIPVRSKARGSNDGHERTTVDVDATNRKE